MEPTSTVIRLDAYRRRPPDPIPTVEEEPGPASIQTLTWKLSQRGNPYVVVNDAFHVVVFRRAGAWAFRIEELESELVLRAAVSDGGGRQSRFSLLAIEQLRPKGPARKP